MAFDSRWEREHNTLLAQLRHLDGLDVGLRRRRASPPPDLSFPIFAWAIAGLRVLRHRLSAYLS